MRSVEMPEVQTHLSALVDEVEHGEEIGITREGRIVARIVPATLSSAAVATPAQRERAQQALRDLAALRSQLNLGPFDFGEFKADRDAGRDELCS